MNDPHDPQAPPHDGDSIPLRQRDQETSEETTVLLGSNPLGERSADPLDDIHLSTAEGDELVSLDDSSQRPIKAGPPRGALLALLALAVVILAVAVWWLLRPLPNPALSPEITEVEEPVGTPIVIDDTPSTAEGDGPEELDLGDLPPVDASDALVSSTIAGLSRHPTLARALATDDLVRTFVVSVENLANGQSPRQHLEYLAPDEPFRVTERDGLPTIDPQSYRRYDPLVSAFVSIEAEDAARLFRALEPLLDDAYRDLGYPDGQFRRSIRRAVQELLQTPTPPAEPTLTPRVITYAYADVDLESLSTAQRQFLRTGPDNVRRVKAQLREISAALELGI